MMKLSLKFVIPLFVAIGIMAYLSIPLANTLIEKWFMRDIKMRSELVASTLYFPLMDLLEEGIFLNKINILLTKVTQDERLFAIGICDNKQRLSYKTATFPAQIKCSSFTSNEKNGEIYNDPKGTLFLSFYDLSNMDKNFGRLFIFHDLSFIQKRSKDFTKYTFLFFITLGLIISLLTVLIAQLSWLGWMRSIRHLLQGKALHAKSIPQQFFPIVKDLRELLREIEIASINKREQGKEWNAQSLKSILQKEMFDDEILVISNREPYIHVRKNEQISIQVPASGLVTALEPIMRACSGTWIAHGSGNADREVVDKNDHVQVPPEQPSYQIRRIWLSKEEEDGYYYGFSNEGLWPLCHIAHVRPIFREEDWSTYWQVNKKFAQSMLEEAKTKNPVVLVHDYHFSLVPAMIREQLPQSTIITFWHIPWSNPESFGICPWREEILKGLLGSTIIGFHTKYHCNNFLDSVDRFLEARVDRETSTIFFQGKWTAVRAYPISIEFPIPIVLSQQQTIHDFFRENRQNIFARYGLKSGMKLGIGVDRLDYTKGILERFRSIERFLEKFSEWQGRFTFIQIAAPTRSRIEEYQDFYEKVVAMAQKINQRFARPAENYQAIILLTEHHDIKDIFCHYRAADLCMVTSLHDGMNLVAKEFLAAREDEQGMLILSQFTGASRELPEALIVNPYNIDQCSMAIQCVLEMESKEQLLRMRSMRSFVREFNVFYWAGKMLLDAAKIRQRNRIIGQYDPSSN